MPRLLIVDDSPLFRKILRKGLAKYDDIEVVGEAGDPYEAREVIAKVRPDVLTLDLEMPRMDGIQLLRKLMKHYPLPVVVVSSFTRDNSPKAIEALASGAIEVIGKPANRSEMPAALTRLVAAIRAGATARTRRSANSNAKPAARPAPVKELARDAAASLIAIGASTGGTRATEAVLRALPPTCPPIVIAQHMPKDFTAAYARRLNNVCRIEVREGAVGDRLEPGVALVAPGDQHMTVRSHGGALVIALDHGEKIHHQRPAVERLFHSVANVVGASAVGVILTGMGADGAEGLLAMRKRGSLTLAQDEQDCVVYGMPKAAVEAGAVEKIVRLADVAPWLMSAASPTRRAG